MKKFMTIISILIFTAAGLSAGKAKFRYSKRRSGDSRQHRANGNGLEPEKRRGGLPSLCRRFRYVMSTECTSKVVLTMPPVTSNFQHNLQRQPQRRNRQANSLCAF